MVLKNLLVASLASAVSVAVAQTPATEATTAAEKGAVAATEQTQTLGEKAASFFDSITDSITNFGKDTSSEVNKYSQELKEKWPGIKQQFQDTWEKGVEQGSKTKDSFNKWIQDTFSQERLDKAENWMKNFKTGTEEKVIDPLVPYLLSMRYPDPLNEWKAGFRRTATVQIPGHENPLELQIPVSWDVSQQMNVDGKALMTWRSESGDGPYSISLISTPNGATVDSVVAGLEKDRPGVKAQKLEGTQISTVAYPANAENPNAVTYYVVPLKDKVVLLAAEVLNQNKSTPEQINNVMKEREPFFSLVAQGVFLKP